MPSEAQRKVQITPDVQQGPEELSFQPSGHPCLREVTDTVLQPCPAAPDFALPDSEQPPNICA